MKFIYFHIGKTGGSTIDTIFKNNSIFKSTFIKNNYEKCIEKFNSFSEKNILKIEYISIHAGKCISFYNFIEKFKKIIKRFRNKIFIFFSIHEPYLTVKSLYKHFNKQLDSEYFYKDFNYNYISNYLYNNNTTFGVSKNPPGRELYDSSEIINNPEFYINDKLFNKLKYYIDMYIDYIIDIEHIDLFIKFINNHYNINLVYNNIIINKTKNKNDIDLDYFKIKNIKENKLFFDTNLYERYMFKKIKKIYFGTCRIYCSSSKYFNNHIGNDISELNFTNNLKEVIQMIKYIKNELIIPEQYYHYCFRGYATNFRKCKVPINLDISYLNNLLEKTDIIIIEICSNKMYYKDDYICCWDVISNASIKKTEKKITNEEIENDLIYLKKIVNKPILIISHINVKDKNNMYLPSRDKLIKSLKNICLKLNINFFDPSIILNEFNQEDIILNDLTHYTTFGLDIVTKLINYNVNEILINK